MADEVRDDALREVEIQKAQERKQVREFFGPRIEMATRSYEKAITGLWLGNAGAAIATLNFIGGKFRGVYHFPVPWLLSLGCFVSGLILMGFGAGWTLYKEKQVIDRIDHYNTFLDIKLDEVKSNTEIIGLYVKDIRTITALIAGILFVVGCIFGLILLAYHPPVTPLGPGAGLPYSD